MKILIAIVSFFTLTLIADYTGSWAYTMDDPQGGVIKADFVFAQVDGVYEGHILGEDGTKLPLKDLKIDGAEMSCRFNYQGYDVQIAGAFEGDVLKCTLGAEGYEFPVVAKKRA